MTQLPVCEFCSNPIKDEQAWIEIPARQTLLRVAGGRAHVNCYESALQEEKEK